ncbi:PPC domain-containing protein, partial [Streptomyces sp. NPDC048551]|uniref:PPC domain-containing protein n=1 Tax=Streptomyces sp. NPDC048551 TaxID=3155758 RepID=UPI00341841AE
TGTPQSTCGSSGNTTALAESESNDTLATADDASTLAHPLALTGTMKSTSDRDYFRVSFAANERIGISCAIPDGAYDADLYLLDSAGSTVARSVNDGVGADESLTFTRTATGSGTYYVELDAFQGSGSTPYTCDLSKS